MAPSFRASDAVLDTTAPYKLAIVREGKQYMYYQVYLNLDSKQTFAIIPGPSLACTWAHPHPQ